MGIDENFCLEKRLDNYIEQELKKSIPHEIVRSILFEIIIPQGILINEATLAARLGVQRNNNWIKLLEILEEFKYTGVFSKGWDRWWMPMIENWWQELTGKRTLRRLKASQRVKYLNDIFDLSLIPISPHPKHRSEFYWTCCVISNIPIDPVDGLILDRQENLFPWQEKKYVSIDAATDTTNELSKKVSPLEEKRLENLKKQYSNADTRIRR